LIGPQGYLSKAKKQKNGVMLGPQNLQQNREGSRKRQASNIDQRKRNGQKNGILVS
jgi:hypothetical protein